MNRLVLLAGLIIILAGCTNRNTPPPPTPTLDPPTQAAPTPTPIPPTATPVELPVQVTAELANCRFGPGTVYQTMNEIRGGRLLNAVGRDATSNWWQVEDPINPGGYCWVAAEVTEIQGDAEQLTVVNAPFVTITKVELRVEPTRIVVNCNEFPQTVFFEAAITANGPTLLTWQWEASNGVVSDVGTLIYEESGTQLINEFYRVNAPNEYWVKLKILTPNQLEEKVTFPVSCTP